MNIKASRIYDVEQDHHGMEKPIDFWLRKGKAGGEPEPTEKS